MGSMGQYDKDCLTWSPQGEIVQIKHAKAAVDQGTALLGLKSKKAAVLACFKKQGGSQGQTEFASYDKKIHKVDDHCAVGTSGLTADARVLTDYMRGECLNHKYVFDCPMVIGRLVSQIGEKAQVKTMKAGKRPYGVGLLINAWDEQGAHIYQNVPSGDYYEYYAMAMGNRSQSAKTYLEKHFETFPDADNEALIRHAVKALSITTEQDKELSTENIDVCIVGDGQPYKLLSTDELKTYLDELKAAADNAAGGAAPMETD